MALLKVTPGKDNKTELRLSIPKADFDAAVSAAYKKNVGKINVPGFRKGKAPKSIIEKMYGKGFFYEEALDKLLPGVLTDALKESGIEAVSRPDIELGEIGDEGVEVIANYFVKPEVILGEYKNIETEKIIRAVSDEDIALELENARQRNGRTIEVSDRAAQSGDTAVIDYEGSVDGVPFDGGKADGHHLKLGSNSFIPGFEDQIIGHSIGDSFDVNVTFPEEYHAEELKGKAACFKVTLNGIEYTELPELDDEFAKEASDFDTLDAYKADIKANIQKRYDSQSDNAFENALLSKLVSGMTADIPACMIDDEVEHLYNDYTYRMQSQGISLDMYLNYTGMTAEKLKEEFRPQAERSVKVRLALEKIAKLEDIAIGDGETDEEYARLASEYKIEDEKAREYFDRELVANDLKISKALKLVKDSAKINEKPFEPHSHECDDENCGCHHGEDHDHE
ncbi:MAG: trigger factor [Oscillospiraceae bacterium]|nr:trigger factor [Oscillospiraceae bacterium]